MAVALSWTETWISPILAFYSLSSRARSTITRSLKKDSFAGSKLSILFGEMLMPWQRQVFDTNNSANRNQTKLQGLHKK